MSYKVRANDQLGYMFDFGPASETLDDAKQKITDTNINITIAVVSPVSSWPEHFMQNTCSVITLPNIFRSP